MPMSNCHTQPTGSSEPSPAYAAFVGIDWADQKHAVCLLNGPLQTETELEHSPEAITEWALSLRQHFDGRPVAIAVEQAPGGPTHALMQSEHLVLFPINPKQ